MSNPFVWFDNIGSARSQTAQFLENMFDWGQQDIGSMIMQVDCDNGPFAGVCDEMEEVSGWVPYVEVTDLEAAGDKAKGAGASIIAENMAGPAGHATFVRDPGGSVLALWKRGEGM